MYSVSQNFHDKALSLNEREVQIKADIEGVGTINGDYIEHYKVTEMLCNGEQFNIGCTPSNTLDISIYAFEGFEPYKGQKIIPYIGIDDEYIPMGHYYIDDIRSDVRKEKYNLVCYDKMNQLTDVITVSGLISDIIKKIEDDYDIQFLYHHVGTNYAFKSEVTDTVRNIIGYIAGFFGCNAIFNRDGIVEERYIGGNISIPIDFQFMDSYVRLDGNGQTITGLNTGTGEAKYFAGTNIGAVVSYYSPVVSESRVQYMLQSILIGKVYNRSVKYRCDPSFEVGNRAIVYIDDTTHDSFVVMRQEINVGGGMNATIYTYGVDGTANETGYSENPVKQNTTVSSDLENFITDIRGRGNGYYDETNDRLYYTYVSGSSIGLYIYHGSSVKGSTVRDLIVINKYGIDIETQTTTDGWVTNTRTHMMLIDKDSLEIEKDGTNRVYIADGALTVKDIITGTYTNFLAMNDYGNTRKVSPRDAANDLINSLGTGDSNPTDNDYIITQYVGGGETQKTYYRRPLSKLYNYLKGKFDTVYEAIGTLHDRITNGTWSLWIGTNAAYPGVTGKDLGSIDWKWNHVYANYIGSTEKVTSQVNSHYYYTDNTSTTSSNYMGITNGGYMYKYASSSKRFKHDIHELNDDLRSRIRKLYDIDVKNWTYNDDHLNDEDELYQKETFGLIAEEVDSILPELSIHDAEGRVENYRDRQLINAMLVLIQEQNERIKSLEEKVKM